MSVTITTFNIDWDSNGTVSIAATMLSYELHLKDENFLVNQIANTMSPIIELSIGLHIQPSSSPSTSLRIIMKCGIHCQKNHNNQNIFIHKLTACTHPWRNIETLTWYSSSVASNQVEAELSRSDDICLLTVVLFIVPNILMDTLRDIWHAEKIEVGGVNSQYNDYQVLYRLAMKYPVLFMFVRSYGIHSLYNSYLNEDLMLLL